MKLIQQYNCLQVPAEREHPHFVSKSTLELEVTCCPSVYSNVSTQTRSAQLACPPAWITSPQGSLHTMDPIYPYMVHSMAPLLGSQAALALDPTRYTHTGMSQTTPGPAILGLPSCERLTVVKINCAITVAQPDTKPPSPAPALTATADKSIKSTDDLIKEFPD